MRHDVLPMHALRMLDTRDVFVFYDAIVSGSGGAEMKTRYRIVTDRYAGFEVQQRRWWWPFWSEVGCNTHINIERAREFARRHAGVVVEYVDVHRAAEERK